MAASRSPHKMAVFHRLAVPRLASACSCSNMAAVHLGVESVKMGDFGPASWHHPGHSEQAAWLRGSS